MNLDTAGGRGATLLIVVAVIAGIVIVIVAWLVFVNKVADLADRWPSIGCVWWALVVGAFVTAFIINTAVWWIVAGSMVALTCLFALGIDWW